MAPNPVLPRPAPSTINVNKTVKSKSGKSFPIKGYVAKGFEPVLEAFEGNFVADKELGSSCCTFRGLLKDALEWCAVYTFC